MLKTREHRVPALVLIWGVSASCKGFALKTQQIRPDHRKTPCRRLIDCFPRDEHERASIIRGGAVDSKILRGRPDTDTDEDKSPAAPSRHDLIRRTGMAAALATTYASVMASKCALPAVLVQLTSPKIGLKFSSSSTSTHQAHMAQLLAISTIAIAAGKLLLGPVIDYVGGIFSLQIALSLLALLLGTISFSNSFAVFAVCWVIVDFIFSSCWAACINAINQSFPEEEWAKRIGMLAAAARAGNAAAFAFFAWILAVASKRMAQPWRIVFAASSLIQAVPIALLTYYGYSAPCTHNNEKEMLMDNEAKMTGQVPATKSTLRGSLATLHCLTKTPAFWLHLVSRSVLMVFASFLLFVPLLMSQAYGASPSTAAQVGSIYAFGCLLSVTFGSNLYSRMSKQMKALLVACLLGLSTVTSLAQLGHMMGAWKLSTFTSACYLFLWGFSFAIPFYIPPSLYALANGGVDSSATIADVFDIGGFGLLAVFNGYVASIQHSQRAAWIPAFQLTTSCSVIALVCLTLAILLDCDGSSKDYNRL